MICVFFKQIAVLALGIAAGASFACELEKFGNPLTGSSYKVTALLQEKINANVALEGVQKKMVTRGQRILSVDTATNTIFAEQGSGNRAIGIQASALEISSQVRVVIIAKMPAAMFTSDDAIKTELCSYAFAAKDGAVPIAAQGSPLPNATPESTTNSSTFNSGTRQAAPTLPENEFIKAGQPCLSGICIGDDLGSIQGIAWLNESPNFKKPRWSPNDTYVASLQKDGIAGPDEAMRKIASAIYYGVYGGEAIAALRRLDRVCNHLPFGISKSEFLSPSGHLTTVLFRPTLRGDRKTIFYRVYSISRHFSDALSEPQKEELSSKLKHAYEPVTRQYAFSYSRSGDFPNVTVERPSGRTGIEVRLSSAGNVMMNTRDAEDLKLQAVCGGKNSMSIN
jgi:hypothetical protein